jgi:hypothetical protein
VCVFLISSLVEKVGILHKPILIAIKKWKRRLKGTKGSIPLAGLKSLEVLTVILLHSVFGSPGHTPSPPTPRIHVQ